MNRKNLYQYLFHFLFLSILFSLTAWVILKDQDFNEIMNVLRSVPVSFIFLGFLIMIVVTLLEATITKHLFSTIKINVSLWDCIAYTVIGYFFCYITPSASGGQPMQLYYMKKKHIPIHKGSMVLMLISVQHKLILVLVGLYLVTMDFGDFIHMFPEIRLYIYIGLAANILSVTIFALFIFVPDTAIFLVRGIYGALTKIHLMKDKESRRKNMEELILNYRDTSTYLHDHKASILITTLISSIQRCGVFFVTYIVYRSFGLTEYGPFHITFYQSIVNLSSDLMPLPGAVGIHERVFFLLFRPVFGTSQLCLSGMLLSRGITYYLMLVFCGVITVIAHFIYTLPEKKAQK